MNGFIITNLQLLMTIQNGVIDYHQTKKNRIHKIKRCWSKLAEAKDLRTDNPHREPDGQDDG